MGQRGTDECHAKIDEQCKSKTLVHVLRSHMTSTEMMGSYWGTLNMALSADNRAQFRKRETAPFLASNSRRRRFCQEPGWPRGNGEPDTFSIDNGHVLNVMIMP